MGPCRVHGIHTAAGMVNEITPVCGIWCREPSLFTIDLCARRSSNACVEGNGMPVANDREGREFDAWVGVCNAAVWDDIT